MRNTAQPLTGKRKKKRKKGLKTRLYKGTRRFPRGTHHYAGTSAEGGRGGTDTGSRDDPGRNAGYGEHADRADQKNDNHRSE